MSSLPDDDDLTALLDSLDVDATPNLSIKPTSSLSSSILLQANDDSKDEDEDVPEHTIDETIGETIGETSQVVDKEDFLPQYKQYSNELLMNYRKDRKDIDNFMQYLYKKLKKGSDNRVIFEALTQTLRTKCESNSNLIKLMEGISKRIDKTGGGNFNLEELLDG